MNVSNIIITESDFNFKGFKKISIKYSQLFHPSSRIKLESVNKLILDDVLGNSKFDKIIIKEAISILALKGNLLITFSTTKFNNFLKTKAFINKFKKFFNLIDSGQLENFDYSKFDSNSINLKNRNSGFYIYINKIKSFEHLQSKITQWSFGIISNGKNDNQVDKIINSILNMKVPQFEIKVCGEYRGKFKNKVKIIRLQKFDDKGWITKKKNKLVQNFQYENCCIVHDRIIFDKNWYKGMIKWGNHFEHLGCTQKYLNKRTNDWLINERYFDIYFGFASLLDYQDWSNHAFIGGQLHIFKKSIFLNRGWNNFLFWNEAEDYEISRYYNSKGHILRFNPYSEVNTLSSRYNDIPKMIFNPYKRSNKYKGNPMRILGRKAYRYLYSYKFFRNTLPTLFKSNFTVKIVKNIFKAF